MYDFSVTLIKGGISGERDISLLSALNVEKSLIALGIDYSSIDFTSLNDLSYLSNVKNNIAFIALHGGFGENGGIQSVMDMLKIHYTHSGVIASAIGMDKMFAKNIMHSLNIETPKARYISNSFSFEILNKQDCIIKPIKSGSSLDIITKHNYKTKQNLDLLLKQGLMLEDYIYGQELQVAILDDKPIGVAEIKHEGEIFDYSSKYTHGLARKILPPSISTKIYNKAMEQALNMHKYIGCRCISRSDFIYETTTDKLFLLEINTHPGLTETSILPIIAQYYQNLSMKDIVNIIIKSAIQQLKQSTQNLAY